MDIANLQIKADSTQVNTATKSLKGLEGQSRKTEGSVKNLGNSAKKGSADFGILEKSIFSVKNLIGTVLIGSVVSFADEMTNVTARIENSTRSIDEAKQAFNELSQIANQTGGSISASVDVFQRLSFVRDEINASISDMTQFTGTVQKFGVVSGASTGALNAGLLQLGQALSSDVTRAEEFNSIMENIPAVGVAIAKEFGVTTGQLRQLVLEGEVLSKDVFAAILNQSEKANEQFDKMPITIGRATSQLINQFKIMVAGINDSTNASQGFAIFIGKVTEAVKGLNFVIVGLINTIESLLIAAAGGVLQLINAGIEGLNRFGNAVSTVYNSLSQQINSVTGGLVNIGEREARSFQPILPNNQFIKEAATEEIQKNFIELAELNNSLFEAQSKNAYSVRELSQNYTEKAAALKESNKESDKAGREAEKAVSQISRVTESLEFQIEQLGRTNEMQEVYNNLRSAGTTLDTEAGQKIASLTLQYERQSKELERQKKFADGLAGSFETFFSSAIRGTDSLSNALDNLANSIIDLIFQLTVLDPLREGLSGAFGGGSGGGGGGFLGGIFDALGFASGGSFTVGGSGGPDSQFVPLRLTPGEVVNVQKGGQNSRASAPNIIINNNAPNASVSAGYAPNGKDIQVLIDEAVSRNISTPGTRTFNSIRRFNSAPLSRG